METKSLITITVCICTYRRNELLKRLLEKLNEQECFNDISFSVVVIDNDRELSAREVVDSVQHQVLYKIIYDVEPEKNIALARNRAIKNANGEYIVFIDDDEFPVKEWLHLLFVTLNENNADVCFGPVKPFFEHDPPPWIVKGNILERDSFATGTIINNSRYTRTGNVMIAKKVLIDNQNFNPSFGCTGGEDVDFFKRMLDKGYKFVWCNEAVAYESVPSERMTRKYHLRRALLRGYITAKREKISLFYIGKSLCAICLYTLILPAAILFGQQYFMKILIRFCDHSGKLLTYLKINPIVSRDDL